MKKILMVGIAAAFCGAPALAADLPMRAPAYGAPVGAAQMWTGCYIGGNLGGVWGDSKFDWSNFGTGFAAGADTQVIPVADATLHSSGFTGGGQLGCNAQFGAAVIGLEGDIQYTGLSANRAAATLGGGLVLPANINESFSSHWLSTIRGRLGFVNGGWLIYGTGGLAVANVSYSDQNCFVGIGTPGCNTASASQTRTGWTVGGGAEWIIEPGWTIRLEYLYADLGNTSYNSQFFATGSVIPTANTNITHSHNLTENLVRLGLNYKFD
jgi:outer membrane immunogenic protein